MKFGRLIRHAREHRNIGLNEFARHIRVSPAYLSRIERGREKPPQDYLVTRIADALELSHDQMFVAAGRLPPDLQTRLDEVVAIIRGHYGRRDRAVTDQTRVASLPSNRARSSSIEVQ